MREDDFSELVASIKEAGDIKRGNGKHQGSGRHQTWESGAFTCFRDQAGRYQGGSQEATAVAIRVRPHDRSQRGHASELGTRATSSRRSGSRLAEGRFRESRSCRKGIARLDDWVSVGSAVRVGKRRPTIIRQAAPAAASRCRRRGRKPLTASRAGRGAVPPSRSAQRPDPRTTGAAAGRPRSARPARPGPRASRPRGRRVPAAGRHRPQP